LNRKHPDMMTIPAMFANLTLFHQVPNITKILVMHTDSLS